MTLWNKCLRILIRNGGYAFISNVRQLYHEHRLKLMLNQLRYVGKRCQIEGDFIIKNPQYISIGDNFVSMYNLRIEAWDEYFDQRFTPDISIGNNVSINTDCHIGCINKVVIGNDVLIASRVFIADHNHGEATSESLKVAPSRRPLVSKGGVFISDNVWIGEGAAILNGVTIGENSIIGANAVVTGDIPPNCIAVGVPAKVIKSLEQRR